MSIKTTPYLAIALALISLMSAGQAYAKNGGGGEDVQRNTIRTVALQTTRVDSVSIRDFNLSGLGEGSEYRLAKPLNNPFELLDPLNRPVIVGQSLLGKDANSTVQIRVRFRPVTPGVHRDSIVAIRLGPFNQKDTLKVYVEGLAFIPARTVHMDFGETLTGEVSIRTILVPDAAKNDWKISDDLPFSVSDIEGGIPDPQKPGFKLTKFELRFQPQVEGEQIGRITIIRNRSIDATVRVLDTLYVNCKGIGTQIYPTPTVAFGNIMIGDKAKRQVELRIGELNLTYYKLVDKPNTNPVFGIDRFKDEDSPIANDPLGTKGDVLTFYPTFEPHLTGPYRHDGVVVFYRMQPGRQEPLDSLVCTLSGTGIKMKPDAQVSFSAGMIARLDSSDVTLEIPVSYEQRKFSYLIKSPADDSAGISARLIQPDQQPSSSVKLSVRVFSKPQYVGVFTDEVLLVRIQKNAQGEEITLDTTTINLRTEVKPREVHLQATINLESVSPSGDPQYANTDVIEARIGDTITVAVIASTEDPIDRPVTLSTVRCSLSYNPSVLVPLAKAGDETRSIDDEAVFVFGPSSSTVVDRTGTVLARARFAVVMGDAESSPLAMTGLDIRPINFIERVDLDTTIVRVTNAWKDQDGRTRLVNSLQGVLQLDVAPNPAIAGTFNIAVDDVPQGRGILHVVSTEGVVVADLTDALRSGQPLTIQSMPRGVYFVRLMVNMGQSDDASSVASVVRIVVVQ